MAIQYFAMLDSEGFRAGGLYRTDLNKKIPPTATPVTREQWQALISDPYGSRIVNGAILTDKTKPPPVIPPSAAFIKTQLAANDVASVRALREWALTQPNPSTELAGREVIAQALRAKLGAAK